MNRAWLNDRQQLDFEDQKAKDLVALKAGEIIVESFA
jgi:hypothetical protein